MADSVTTVWYCDLGGSLANAGSIRFAWRAKEDKYKDIAKALGVTKSKDTDKGLVFGANSPRPARVRINLGGSTKKSSIIRFAQIDNLNDLVTGGSLNGKKYQGINIDSVSLIGSSR
ncbi:hypothetical protein DO97_17460 [Neosynechococcus sphagnicola sy1]|uniref:Uncharacterized protein n=1 Tax=Neosynechococcus sphagnicola sy1 TaxID=1497020 RepID=A0A098THQ6_9CYAN|nr:hypothetical protein [Neosynechococcus sphagnicola]KGF71619.1 hypothetical protein DO97_17460 [Neosynechococcus sphagnicola sy1]